MTPASRTNPLWLLLLVGLVVCLTANPAAAQEEEQRLALVIGVGDYRPASLPNTHRDADLMEATLSRAGFSVTRLNDPTKGELREAVRTLSIQAEAASADTTVAFYYAGHAVQFEGRNYLIPKDAEVFDDTLRAADLEDSAVNAQWVLDRLSDTGIARLLIVFDACRTSPFVGRPSFGAIETGLSRMAPATNGPDTMILYAAQPGAAALDGPPGGHGPFAAALAQTLILPGVPVGEAFSIARDRVDAETGGRQRPWVEGLLQFSFMGESSAVRSLADSARMAGAEDGAIILRATLETHSMADLRRSAEAGNGFDLYLIGIAYWDGIGGVEKDGRMAMAYMRRAVARGVGRAATSLGFFYCCADIVPKNHVEAVAWFHVGMELGSLGAVRNLGYQYREGLGVEQNIDEAIRYFTLAGEGGLGAGWWNLGLIYAVDDYGRKNDDLAMAFYERALASGYADAALNVAGAYQYGILGQAKDPQSALATYIDGARAGCVTCWRIAGDMYADGTLGPPDLGLAYALYDQGRQAGDLEAAMAVGRALRTGSGVEADQAAAFRVFEAAAANGSNEARGSVASALAKGEGVPADPRRAAPMLREVLALDQSTDPAIRHSI